MNSHFKKTALAACAMAALVFAGPAAAAVRVLTGPTPIPDGEARAAGDISVVNQKLAFSLAVESAVPYGVPRGALVDVAVVSDGSIGRDRAVFADFIPNNWSAWPNTYQRVDILERGPRQAVVRAVRDWGKVTITTLYTLKDNADHIEIETSMRNDGDVALPDLLSGLTYWPKGGFLFGVPGAKASGAAPDPLARRMVAYDEDWSVALHAAYFDDVEYGSKDLYLRHTLAPGASRAFSAWLQVGASGDLAPVIAAEIGRQKLAAGTVHGTVRGADGEPVAQAVVMVEKAGRPYGWTLAAHGAYRLDLPAGEYALYATAKGHTQSARQTMAVAPKANLRRDFGRLQGPGQVHFQVSGGSAENGPEGADPQAGAPLDARIEIARGQQPVVEFLGKKTFFTELDRQGVADIALAPGAYEMTVASGGGFLNESATVELQVAAGAAQTAPVRLRRFADPAARGWYAADMHHHADQAEAVTPPADVARAQLAAGLDLLFVSDHDSMVNLAAMQRIADRRGMPFIGSMELSASWAHFNAYPLAAGQTLGIDMSSATVQQIFGEARRLGATTLQVNHPFIPYGYFASLDAQAAPGGYDTDFNVVEINAATPGDDVKVLKRLWDDWNQGKQHYLAAGNDVHDVWKEHTGRVRTFAHIEGKPSAVAFALALNAGRAYVSYGPLIYPDTLFGAHLRATPGRALPLGFALQSLAGIRQVQLIGDGAVLETRTFADLPRATRVDFSTDGGAGWYALVVEDRDGRQAYTNPVWVDRDTNVRAASGARDGPTSADASAR